MLQWCEPGHAAHQSVTSFHLQYVTCLMRNVLLKGKMFCLQHVAWNSAGLNLCIITHGENHLNFQSHVMFKCCSCKLSCCHIEMNQYLLCVHQLKYMYCSKATYTIYKVFEKFPNETIHKEHIQTMLLALRNEKKVFFQVVQITWLSLWHVSYEYTQSCLSPLHDLQHFPQCLPTFK